MRRSLWVLVGIVIGVAGTSFLFAPSVAGARAGNFTSARASGFVWENGAPTAPEGASDFCSAVYAGTGAEVSILMTLPDGAELVGAPIEDFFTIIETGDLISVRPCFDQDPTNDPQGRVLLHQDFWDSAQGVWDHVPVLGTVIRWIQYRETLIKSHEGR